MLVQNTIILVMCGKFHPVRWFSSFALKHIKPKMEDIEHNVLNLFLCRQAL